MPKTIMLQNSNAETPNFYYLTLSTVPIKHLFVLLLGFFAIGHAPTTFASAKPEGNAPEKAAPPPKKEEPKKPQPQEKAPPPVIEGPDAKNALGTDPPTRYVHQWIPMPQLIVTDLESLKKAAISPVKGRMMVVFFIASWCEPCQDLAQKLQSTALQLSSLPIDFFFVFAHDSVDDAKGFAFEHKISHGYLAELETLRNYNNPELPTVYIADRDGWLFHRYLKATSQDIEEVKRILRLQTAI